MRDCIYAPMELNEKVHYGIIGVTAASVVLETLGVRLGSLEIAGIIG